MKHHDWNLERKRKYAHEKDITSMDDAGMISLSVKINDLTNLHYSMGWKEENEGI